LTTPSKIEPSFLKCSCSTKQCPVHSKCCFLPTECHPDLKGEITMLFVGQGGGRDERKLGRPFIGKAGRRIRQQILYLRKKLKKQIGVAFSNIIRDNPDDNRAPTDEELEYCLKFLHEDIRSLKEKGLRIVVPLGNAAKTALIKQGSGGMSQDRGTIFRVSNPMFGEIPMMPTFHPSYIMRNVPVFNEQEPSELDMAVIGDIQKAYEYSLNSPAAKSILKGVAVESEQLPLF